VKNDPSPTAGPRKARFGSRRADIVALLQGGHSTVFEMASHLRLTRNAVRSHLLALEREGLVMRTGSQAGRRRPHEVYALTDRAEKLLLRAADVSLSSLLSAMKERLPERQLREVVTRAGDVLAERFFSPQRAKSLRARVQSAVGLLNALGGAAQSEKSGEGYAIRSKGCPLAQVVLEHPETCQLVERFLSQLIGSPVHEQCLRNGKASCRFRIGSTAES
jgi:predicted ArsR family transcriptional regulator